MQYKVYCLLKNGKKDDKIIRVKVFADCIAEALSKAKEMFSRKIKNNYNIFMYETAK